MRGPSREVAKNALARRQRGAITRVQLRACGYTDRQIEGLSARGEIVRVHPQTFRIAVMSRTWEGDVISAALSMKGLWIAGFRTAARLWELDDCESNVIELVGTSTARRRKGVVLHETDHLPVAHVSSIRGIRLTSVPRTLIDLGRVASPDLVEAALESALRRGLISLDYLNRQLAAFRGRGRGGCRVLDQILRLRTGLKPTESALETRLFRILREGGLPLPERQVPVYDHRGTFIARPDLLYSTQRIAIEGLSRRHHFAIRDIERDAIRRNRLAAAGYRVLEVTHARLSQAPEEVVAEVARALGMGLR